MLQLLSAPCLISGLSIKARYKMLFVCEDSYTRIKLDLQNFKNWLKQNDFWGCG